MEVQGIEPRAYHMRSERPYELHTLNFFGKKTLYEKLG